MAKPKLALVPAAQGSKFYSVLPSDGVGDFDFARASAATRINKYGLIETVTSGQSRLNYPLIDGVVNGCPHHILEPVRINLFPYSSDYSQTDWNKFNITIEPNSTISPDGTLNADKILETVSSTNGHFMFDVLGLTPNVEYNFSIFVKKLNRRYVALQNSYNNGNGSIAFFDLDTESLVYTYSAGTLGTFVVSDAKIEKYPNGWYRLSATFESTVSSGVLPSLVLADSQWSTGFSYNNIYTGDVTKGIYVWGAQVEQGSYPTSYIPTSGTIATRSAETANNSGDASTFNDSEGVLYFETKGFVDTPPSSIYIQLSKSGEGSFNNSLVLQHRNNGYLRVYVNGSTTPDIQFNVNIDFTENHKIAVLYKLNGYKLFIDGVEQDLYLTPTQAVFIGLDNLSFDLRGATGWNGNIKQLQYFDSALNDSELETLTSWVSFQDMAEGQLYTIE
jgi:hypothetical protein